MSLFFLLFLVMPFLDLVWWRWADVRLRRAPPLRYVRVALAAFIVCEVIQFLYLLLARGFGVRMYSPMLLIGSAYLWHLVILPVLSVATFAYWVITKVARASFAWLRRPVASRDIDETPKPSDLVSRRQFLAASAVLAPPMLCLGFTSYGVSQRHAFRIRKFDIPLASLPRELDGITLAHVSDIHLGKFTDEAILKNVVRATNDLRADAIVFTGDLIDFDLRDLSTAIEYTKKFDAPAGVYLCEGNHDLFQSRSAFEDQVRASGVPLLLDEVANLRIRGRDVQLLGMQWDSGPHSYPIYKHHLDVLRPHRDEEAFQILLAHHPHAFDRAAEAGIPLVLSGHTHGGQLMLTPEIGGGPMLFKYWSGLYRQGDSALVVSNGVGNWFPLRIGAPAEILHLTLRCA